MNEPRFIVIIHTPQELNHSSYLQTGLFELENRGLIKVKVKLNLLKNRGTLTVDGQGNIKKSTRPQPKTSFYTLIDTNTKKRIQFATDLYDFAEHFSEPALAQCDYYFKRNFETRFVDPTQSVARAKILPLGISFGTYSPFQHGKIKFFLGLFLANLRLNAKPDRLFLNRLIKTNKAQRKHWRFINTSRAISRFEALGTPAKNSIMYQTRCFLHENAEDVKQIHQQRYRLIKLLRQQYPNQFLGGFIPSKISRQFYADALTNVPSEPEAYLDAMKQAKIVIYTRGLANSPAWKMAEYLSQGKVIIAEPLTTHLPIPLTEGKELLYFHNDAELIEKINLVLADDSLASRLSKNARSYFEAHVHPVQNVRRILELMLKKPLAQS
jgi:glycosyltransferase involved in cell wall biosynthesis